METMFCCCLWGSSGKAVGGAYTSPWLPSCSASPGSSLQRALRAAEVKLMSAGWEGRTRVVVRTPLSANGRHGMKVKQMCWSVIRHGTEVRGCVGLPPRTNLSGSPCPKRDGGWERTMGASTMAQRGKVPATKPDNRV